jgi:hypothetical protein
MHKLHLATVKADSPEDACNEIENEIVDFGNDNNWRTICGCIREDNKVYIHEDGGCFAPEKSMKISNVENMIRSWVGSFGYDAREALVKFHIDDETLSAQDWWLLKQLCDHKEHQIDFNNEKFNIWETEYRAWQLDDNGLTNLIQQSDGAKRYVVFIDKHS